MMPFINSLLGERPECEFFQVLDFRRSQMFIQDKQEYEFGFRHVSFTRVVSSQWLLIKTKNLQNFAIVSEPFKQGYSQDYEWCNTRDIEKQPKKSNRGLK